MVNRAKLRWRCRRGMRELDEAMLAYLDNHYNHASDSERQQYEELLDWQDPELFRLLFGMDKDDRFKLIIDKIATTLGDQNRPIDHI